MKLWRVDPKGTSRVHSSELPAETPQQASVFGSGSMEALDVTKKPLGCSVKAKAYSISQFFPSQPATQLHW